MPVVKMRLLYTSVSCFLLSLAYIPLFLLTSHTFLQHIPHTSSRLSWSLSWALMWIAYSFACAAYVGGLRGWKEGGAATRIGMMGQRRHGI